ncbi:M81 family metallopeptidase [Haloferula sargassicola]|uniref:Microcystin degradation protein MlrC n=1 Tax=Haloferula sargassicola TaxID=490096 RepID=A0ABP9UMA3_9BACT
MKPLRLGIAGIHIESSTFSPLLTEASDFLATRGAEMMERYPFLQAAAFASVEPVPLAHFRALPGGQVRQQAYQAMKAEIVERLQQAGPVDAFYFDVHGAMAVEGLDDAEADLLRAIREVLPPGTPVTCSQDLHGNVTDALVAQADCITAYRTAPHVDWMETRERAVKLLLDGLAAGLPVHRARVGIPVLVSGEMSSTRVDPGARLYAPLDEESAREGIMDASLWVGYAWADQPRSMATCVVTGTDESAVRALAESIARRYWQARDEFQFGSPAGPVDWCLEQALACGEKAVFLSDAGDNPTAGAAGDVTHTLEALISHPAFGSGRTAIFASIPDAAAIEQCRAARPGDRLKLRLGGKLDPVHSRELPVEAELVRSVGDQAVVRCGGVQVILTTRRTPFHKRDDFLRLGLDPLESTITVVKIGYLEPELHAMASRHFLVLSPGAVQPDLESIDYRHLTRPMHPLDRDFEWTPRAVMHGPLSLGATSRS